MLSKTQVKYIQSLSHKKFRDEESVFIAEGPKIVSEILAERPSAVRHIYAVNEWLELNKSLVKNINGDKITSVTPAELERVSHLTTPNNVLAVVNKLDIIEDIDCLEQLVIALDGLQDPGNLGTIIRMADWFGVKHILCSMDCADVYNPKVVQSTMGSILRVNMVYTDLDKFLVKQNGIEIMAATLDGIPVQKVTGGANGVLLIGNESKGINKLLLAKATKKITIPSLGKAESLNAAVATGIILSHLVLQ
ncbi:MAG: RNA methyltransferase [Sphingobacteriales bacterium]|nr:RNA methyltransferase [Sphingobacteriales bacterium]